MIDYDVSPGRMVRRLMQFRGIVLCEGKWQNKPRRLHDLVVDQVAPNQKHKACQIQASDYPCKLTTREHHLKFESTNCVRWSSGCCQCICAHSQQEKILHRNAPNSCITRKGSQPRHREMIQIGMAWTEAMTTSARQPRPLQTVFKAT